MALDRDLAVAVVRALEPSPRAGWETTAATGVRGLRLLGESGAFDAFLFSEANPRTYAVLRQNVAVDRRARAILADGTRPPPGAPFDYVDVDPYGSPLPFLPAAVAATADGGVLGVTATDLMVLAGAQPSACRRLYGANPVRGRLGPEGAVRIVLMALSRVASSTGRAIRPLVAYVGGHHVRVYARLGPPGDDPPALGTIDPTRWDGPQLAGSEPLGPMWIGELIDASFADRLTVPPTAAEPGRLAKLLERFREEAQVPRPFYFEANALASALSLPRPPAVARLLSELQALGYLASRTHVRPEGFRTTAPRTVVESVARRLGEEPQSQNARVRA